MDEEEYFFHLFSLKRSFVYTKKTSFSFITKKKKLWTQKKNNENKNFTLRTQYTHSPKLYFQLTTYNFQEIKSKVYFLHSVLCCIIDVYKSPLLAFFLLLI